MSSGRWTWTLSIAATLVLIMLMAAWFAQQQRDMRFQQQLEYIHHNTVQAIHQAQVDLEQKAELGARLLHANSKIRSLILQAAEVYAVSQSAGSELTAVRQQLLAEIRAYWQTLEPYSVRQLHLHLAPDAFTLLRGHRPERHSDKLAEIRPLVMQVLSHGEAYAALEIGRHGAGIRAVVPVKNAASATVAAVEVGLDIGRALSPVADRRRVVEPDKKRIRCTFFRLCNGGNA